MSNSTPASRYYFRDASPKRMETVRPMLTTFNLVTIRESYVFGRHQHFNYQLIFTKRGRYRCTLNETDLVLSPGEVLIVKPGDWHEDQCEPPLSYHAVNFELNGPGVSQPVDLLFASAVAPSDQVLRGSNRELWQIVDRMQAEAKRKDELVTNIENALLMELFWRLIRSIPRIHLSSVFLQHSETQAFGERLRRVFEARLEENLTAVQIATALGVSTRTLTQRCRDSVGLSPIKAYLAHKINHAARLIAHSNLSIKEISHQLGFQNQYHFSRVFRRQVGVPPSEYRVMPK